MKQIIQDLKDSAINIKTLTAQATNTLAKAEKLIDESRSDLQCMVEMLNGVTNDFQRLSNNVNNLLEDENFKPTLLKTADAVSKLSSELAPIIGSIDAKKFGEDINAILKNVNDISASVSTMTKDENLKKNTRSVC